MKQRTPQEIADFFSIVLIKGLKGWDTQPWVFDDVPEDLSEALDKCNYIDTTIDFSLVKDSSLYDIACYFIPNTNENDLTLQSIADFFECYFTIGLVWWHLWPEKPVVKYKINILGEKYAYWHRDGNSLMDIIEDEIDRFGEEENYDICICPHSEPIYLPKK